MKKFIFIVLVAFSFASCKTNAIMIQNNEEMQDEAAGNYEISLDVAYKDSIAKIKKTLPKPVKTVFLKKRLKEKEKARFNDIVDDIDDFLIRAKIIDSAKVYVGTPYHYGGMSEKGIDCSALIYRAYQKNDLSVPRTSIAQSELGEKVKPKKADIGDLIFFRTTRRKRISHVGMVVENYNGDIKFIHASSSKGVMISSLEESYFKKRFVKIKRLIL
jgi:cell wall-associated NlpC family hydrolase